MTDWSSILLVFWFEHAPEVMLLVTALLLLTGYPVAFILGAVALFFAWASYQTGLIQGYELDGLPELVFSQILLDPALLSLPLLLFFTEFLVESGQMERASRAIKTAFNPNFLRQERSRSRWEKTRIAKGNNGKDVSGARSKFVVIFLPAALMAILVARAFELPPEYLTFALMLPATGLFALYVVNWLLDLWVKGDRRKVEAAASMWLGEQVPQTVPGSFLKFLIALLPPLLLTLFGMIMLLQLRVSLFVTLATLSCALSIMALLQGKLQFKALLTVARRAAFATGNLAAMLIGAFCFHAAFLEIGGREKLEIWTAAILPPGSGTDPSMLLMGLILCLIMVGFLVDWIVLIFVLLPVLLPVFGSLDFNSSLTPIWAGASTQMASVNPSNILTVNGLILQEKLWFASLVWFALLTSLATYIRQNGEFVAKRLASDSRKTQDKPTSMSLFLLLQIVGLAAILIAPESVLWLPSLLIG